VCLHDVIAILEDDRREVAHTFERAISLADAGHSRLTLAKTTDPGRLMRWFAPAAMQAMALPASCYEFDAVARNQLAQAAEFVPSWIPVTTLLLGRPTGRALRELLNRGGYDAIVCPERLLEHCPKLARDVRRLGLVTVATEHDLDPTTHPTGAPL
jgi:hypothetical protein